MRRRISFALASVAFSFSAIGGVSAQQLVSTIPAVLQLCPAGSAGSCVPVVRAFVAQRQSSAPSDVDLVDLVAALAGAAQDSRVTLPICLDIADGMRVAGDAMIDAALREQTFALADALCLRGFQTAAIPVPVQNDDDDDDDDDDAGGGNGAGGDTGGGTGDDTGGGDDTDDDTGDDTVEDDDGNNGHGDDADGDDDSNPGNGGDGDEGGDDGNNGHGNDADGDDESNPADTGKGGGNGSGGNNGGNGNGGGNGNN